MDGLQQNAANPYKVLGLTSSANEEEIKKSYKRLSIKYHPDKNRESDTTAIMAEINRAYQTLTNSELKADYDQKADNDDDTPIRDPAGYLGIGKKPSDDFKIKLEMWMKQYDTLILKDNLFIEVSRVIKEALGKEKVSSLAKSTKQTYFCDVCQRRFTDKNSHDSQFTEQYVSILNQAKVPELNELLSKLVGSETWQWLPVKATQRPEYLLKLNEISETIKNDLNNFRKLSPLFDINMENPWLTYFVLKQDNDLIQSVLKASNEGAMSFQTTVDQEMRIKSAIKLGAQTGARGTDVQLINPTNVYTNFRMPTIKVQAPPEWVPDNERTICGFCSEAFTLFNRRHHCRACGDIYCKNCCLESQIPKFGHLSPVKVCKTCHDIITLDNATTWLEHAEILASRGLEEDAGRSLFISTCYATDTVKINKKIMSMGDKFYSQGKYELALRCYYLAKTDLDLWMRLAQEFCEKKRFILAVTCIHHAKTMLKKSNKEMVSYADSYVKSTFSSKTTTKNQNLLVAKIFSLYCFLEGDLKIEDIIMKSTSYEQAGYYDLCSFYLSYASAKKIKDEEWTKLAKTMMDAQCYKTAIYCYYQAKLPIEKWIDIVEVFCNKTPPNYEIAIRLLSSVDELYQPAWNKVKIKSDFTQYFVWIKNCSQQILVDNMLNYHMELVRQKAPNSKLVLCMLFALVFGKVSNFYEESNKYLKKKGFPKAFICFSLSKFLENKQQSWTEYADLILDIEASNAFICFEMDCPNWKKFGDLMFQKKRYTTALNCYLRSGDKEIDRHILDHARQLVQLQNIKKASMYYIQLYKNNKFIIDIVQDLCQMYPQGPIKEIVLATMKKHSSNYDNKSLNMLHYAMSMILKRENNITSVKAAVGALHYVGKYDKTLLSEMPKIQQSVKEQESSKIYQTLKDAIYAVKPKDLASMLVDLDDIQIYAIKLLYQQQVGDRDITQLPDHYKCLMYLLSASIKIFERQFLSALNDLKAALVCYPVGDLPAAVAMMLQNENIQIEMYENLISQLTDISKSSSWELDAFCNTSVPDKYFYQELLKGSPILTMIRKFEKAISTRAQENAVESAMLYLDLSAAVGDAAGFAACFAMAGLHFLDAQSQTSNGSKIYAYRNIIVEVMLNAYAISTNHLTPSMQIHMNKLALITILQANQNLAKVKGGKKFDINPENIIDSLNSQAIQVLVTNIIRKARVAPIINLPTSYSCDTIYLDLACRTYTQPYLERLTDKGNSLCPAYLADYYLFEGAWKHWFTSDVDFDQLRLNSMRSLLESRGWKLTDVQGILDWSALQRTEDGWLDTKESKLNFPIESFSQVIGVQFNIEAGTISFLFKEAKNNDGLFTSIDLSNVLLFGVKGAFFTLDQPDTALQSHPFQEMKYYPKDLAHTDYLATLFHTDYLLKMISTGVEISAGVPFSMKKAQDGFMQRLPQYLKDALKPISERDSEKSFGSETAHRFWIEAGELKYDVKEKDGVITYLFSDVKMEVKKHLLKYNSDGELVDAPDDKDDKSPEAEFARSFTKHYEEIGKYFPELLRLKELLKLGALSVCIQSTYKNLTETIKNIEADTNAIRDSLNQIKNQMIYPQANSYNIDKFYNETLRKNGIYNESSVDWTARNKLKVILETSSNKRIQKI